MLDYFLAARKLSYKKLTPTLMKKPLDNPYPIGYYGRNEDVYMTREFIRLFEFEKQCNHIGLIEDDILSVEIRILLNPACGTMIQGTGGIRKLRVAYNNKGKSGGVRVIYLDFAAYSKTYFITVYSKGEMDNLSQAERNELKELVVILKNELRKQ